MPDKPTISYDDQYDILYVHSGEKVQDTVQRGNFVVELGRNNQVVGIQIENASSTFSDLLGDSFTRENLSNVLTAEIQVNSQGNVAFVILIITLEKEGEEVKRQLPVNLPSGTMATA